MPASKPLCVEKTWGHELWIANNEEFCGKVLHIEKGCRTSLHHHVLKREFFYIIQGDVDILYIHPDGTREHLTMNQGDVLEIPRGVDHRLAAISGDADVMEVSSQHFDSDSFRVERGD